MKLVAPFLIGGACLLAQTSWAFDAVTQFDTDAAHVIVVKPLERWTGNTGLMEKSLDAVAHHTGCFVNFLDDRGHRESSCKNFFGFGGVVSPDSKLVIKTFEQLTKVQPTYDFSSGNSGNHLVIKPPVTLTPEEFNLFKLTQDSVYLTQKIEDGDPDTLSGRVSSARAFQTLLQVALTASVIGNSGLGAQNAFSVANNIGIPEAAKALTPRVGGALSPAPIPALSNPSEYTSVDVRRVDVIRPGLGQIIIAYRKDKTPDDELEALSQAIAIAMAPQLDAKSLQEAREADLADRRQFWASCKADPDCLKVTK